MIHIYNQDCMEAMASMQDNEFDLAIVDPPYGIGNWIPQNKSPTQKKIHFKEVSWNDNPPPKEYFIELKRVSKRQIIWGANYYNDVFPSAFLCWYKGKFNPQFSACEMASLSWGRRCDYVHIDWQSGFFRTLKDGKQIHPCQKPVALYTWLIDRYASKGWKILDTHLGSGSSAIAAHNMGYEFHGYELDTEYYLAAKERLENHQKQLKLPLEI